MHFLAYHALAAELERAQSFHDIFALVQLAVEQTLRESRAGLNLGIMELGNKPGNFLGAFYPSESNIIVMNNTPLRRIMETNPALFKPYVFHVLLHEYLHSLGYVDERTVRTLAKKVCRAVLGDENPATQMTDDIGTFLDDLTFPDGSPRDAHRMLLIEDLDRGMDYVG